jgi:hypothetical protein
MVYRFDEVDDLPLVRRQLGVVRRNGAAEERQWSCALVMYRTEAGTGSITVDDERLVKVWQL